MAKRNRNGIPKDFKPQPLRHCVCGCGRVAFHGVGCSRTQDGTWYAAECFWRSSHGVAMALSMAASANAGIDDEED